MLRFILIVIEALLAELGKQLIQKAFMEIFNPKKLQSAHQRPKRSPFRRIVKIVISIVSLFKSKKKDV